MVDRKTKIVIVNLSSTSSCGLYAINLTENIFTKYENLLYVGSKNSVYNDKAKSLQCKSTFVSTYNNKVEFLIRSVLCLPLLAIRLLLIKNAIYVFPLHHFWNALIMIMLKLKNAEIYLTVHDDKMHKGLYNSFEAFMTDFQIKIATRHIYLTHYVKNSIKERLFVDKKYRVIPIGTYDYPKLNRDLRDITSKTTLNLLLFGVIAKYKGIDILLDAFCKVSKKYENIQLSIIGKHAEPQLINQKTIDEYGIMVIDKHIPNDELYRYFNVADIVVLPYLEASQSGVISVSQYCSIPPIVTNVGGLPEMVAHEKTGIICEPNSEDLYRAICFLIDNKDLYREISKNIHASLDVYSWGYIAEKYIDFIFDKN